MLRRSVLSLILAAVLLLSPGSALRGANNTNNDDIQASLKSFTKVLEAVETNFADPVKTEKAIYDGAIPGMLRTLDPHSNFFDPEEQQRFRENQRGQYFGVGMYVGVRNGHVTVMYPFHGSPAKNAGLRPADQLFRVNGKNTEKSTVEEVVGMLKGPRGTPVHVEVKREGREALVAFDLVRDQVDRPSVSTATWLKPGIAFIRIDSFNENTSKEFESEMKKLGEEKVEGLLIDLRENPGGILQEAVAVTDRFLERGQGIVSQRGRISPERPFQARRGNVGRKYPIVVMVSRGSASASEIVSGALQDHDRAWIFGQNTFGKGLVQAPYPLSFDCQLLLTVARYYTPSGRLIQRDYSKGTFFEYYYPKSTELKNKKEVRSTDSGRVVYGGGGITPDEEYKPVRANKFQSTLINRGAFFGYTGRRFGPGDAKLPDNWDIDLETLEQFRAFLTEKKIPYEESEFVLNLDWVKRQLKLEMYTTAFGKEKSDEAGAASDPEVLKAIESLSKAKLLLEKSKRMVARRR
ncbi:MAG: PDZ domain-containing protein [Candidatus Solibacter usitatus]|nr:PDZ domain-containing protein [Candidatus Solibacter usitatus]